MAAPHKPLVVSPSNHELITLRQAQGERIESALPLHFVSPRARTEQLEGVMLETIAVILIVLWLLGLVSGYTMGNFIYVLLVIAIVLFLVRLISGRRVV